jgi:hypothetical protein
VRILELAAKYLLIGVVALYACDFLVFQVRRARGTGIGSMQVEQYLATPLKGSKAEYDYLGTAEVNCAKSLLPQYAQSRWNAPCWWLAQHKEKWE